jgi:AcrR family transcriptional regulator
MGRSARRTRETAVPARGAELAAVLRDAAEALILERGPQGFSLREVARRARVSEAAPYRYFPNKEALLAGVAESGFGTLAQRMEAHRERVKDPGRRFQELGVTYVRFALEHPAYLRIMFGPEISDKSAYPALKAAANHAFALLVAVIADAQRAGIARSGDAKEMALAAWALIHGLSALLIDGQLKGDARTLREAEALAARLTRLLRIGLETERG